MERRRFENLRSPAFIFAGAAVLTTTLFGGQSRSQDAPETNVGIASPSAQEVAPGDDPGDPSPDRATTGEVGIRVEPQAPPQRRLVPETDTPSSDELARIRVEHRSRYLELVDPADYVVVARFLDQEEHYDRPVSDPNRQAFWVSNIVVSQTLVGRGRAVPARLLLEYPAHMHSLLIRPGLFYLLRLRTSDGMNWTPILSDDFSAVGVVDNEIPSFGTTINEFARQISK